MFPIADGFRRVGAIVDIPTGQNGFKIFDSWLDPPRRTLEIMRLFWTLGALLATVAPVFGLHFYLEASEERCFIEELPSETIVEGALLLSA